jgi:hypothetical protein
MTRREITTAFFGAFALILAPSRARACLYGRWYVLCRNGHIDVVTDGTCNHQCDDGQLAFKDGEGDIVCPNRHVNHVVTGKGVITSFKCRICGTECRIA